MPTAALSLSTLAALCDEAAVNSGLLHHSIADNADTVYARQERYVRYTRTLTGLCCVAAGGAGVLARYHYATLHRVWRLRNPRKAQQCFTGAVGGGAFAVTGLLFMISPVGFMAKHAHGEHQAQELDALAVQSLRLRQDFATLHALCTLKAGEGTTGVARWAVWCGGRRTPESGLGLRRAVLAIDSAAYVEVALTEEEEEAGAPESVMGSTAGGPDSPRTACAEQADTRSALDLEKAKLAKELLRHEDGASPTSVAPRDQRDTTATRRREVHYTVASSPVELERCYHALSAEWQRVTASHDDILSQTL